MQKTIEYIIESIAREKKLPVEVVKAVVDSQFLCSRENAKIGEKGKIETYKNIRWRNLGTLIVKPGRLKIIHGHANKNNNNQSV